MLEDLIKLAIEKINAFGEMEYEVIEGTEDIQPCINVKLNNGYKEEVVFDLSLIQSITATNNTLMLYEDGAITIISPANWTYHQTQP